SALNVGRRLKTFDFQDNASYVFGRHNIQFGFQAQLIRLARYSEVRNLSPYSSSVPTVFLGTGTGLFNDANERAVFAGSYYMLGAQRFFPVNGSGVLGAVPAV